MPIKIEGIKLTRAGRAKLGRVGRIALSAARKSLRRNFQATRRAIVGFAPTFNDEAVILSQGIYNGRVVGVPSGGRFMKLGSQRTVREAIMEEKPVITSGKNGVSLRFGSMSNLNHKIGFSWITSKGHTRRTSIGETLWGNLIQAWEGDFATTTSSRIIPRGPYPLRPDNRTVAPFVDKSITPFHMFRRGYNSTRKVMKKNIIVDIKTEVRRIR